MAARVFLLTFLLVVILHHSQVAGYYCDSDRCGDDEYCCGYNICCKSYKVWELWYFWFGIAIILILLIIFGCFWKYQQNNNYLTISSEIPYTALPHGSVNPAAADSFKSVYPPDGNGGYYTRLMSPSQQLAFNNPGNQIHPVVQHSKAADSYFQR